MSQPTVDLFAEGTVGQTIAASIVADVALFGGGDLSGGLPAEVFLLDGLGSELLGRLLAEVERSTVRNSPARAIALAEAVLALVGGDSELAEGAMRCVAGAYVELGDPRTAEETLLAYRRHHASGLSAASYEVLGGALQAQERLSEALGAFLEGARAADPESATTWRLLRLAADCFLRLGDFVRAHDFVVGRLLEVALRLEDPALLSSSWGLIGLVRMQLGLLPDAREASGRALDYARLAGRAQDESDWLGNLGSIALLEGDAEEAVRLHSEALALSHRTANPESVGMDLGNLATAHTSLGQWDRAIELRQEAIRVAENSGDAERLAEEHRRLRDLFLHLGQWRRAVAIDELLNQVVPLAAPPGVVPAPQPEAPVPRRPPPTRIEPTDFELAMVRETSALIAAQEHAQARQVAERFVRAHPDNVAGLFQLGLVLNESGDYEASLEAYDRCRALAPRLTRLHRNMLNSWRGLGDLDTPLWTYRMAIADDPFDPFPRLILAVLLVSLGRHEDAVREAREAVRLDSEVWDYQYALCQILSDTATQLMPVTDEEIEAPLEAYQSQLAGLFDSLPDESDPEADPGVMDDARLGPAVEEDRTARLQAWESAWSWVEESVVELDRLVAMDEEFRPSALKLKGERCYRMAHRSVFANHTILGSMIDSREAWLLGHAAAAFASAAVLAPQAGMEEAFLDVLRTVGSPDDPLVWVHFAIGMSDAGDWERAITSLEIYLEEHPPHPEVLYQLGQFLTRSAGDLERAQACFAQAAALEPDEGRFTGALAFITRQIDGDAE
ncbi:tetratricopeptide repeat protein [Streptomyces sp. NEAU-NA10]|uniref:tetratricopeptide repeat protein n=1 Tax=Streptomyces sp. NEAU-NA10 TaxID=3416050 RepID=UPI003CC652B7